MGFSVKDPIRGDITGNAGTVNHHTVEKDVPADAKFTDTTYSSKAAVNGGTDVSLVTTGEKYTWDTKQPALSSQTAYSAKGTATKVPQITTNTLGQVTKIEEVTITQPTVNNGKLTIQKNGTDIQTFTANQSSNVTANIIIPTKVSELTNDSEYTSNIGTITGVSINGASVATSGVANITSVPASTLTGAIPSAVTATTQSASDNSTKVATTAFVKTAIDNLPEPMVFKGSLGTGGTVTSLPTNGTANVGDTYKVITTGTYAGKAAKVGDTFICLTKTSNTNTWELIPSGDEPNGTVTSVTLNATSPIIIDNSGAITTSGTRTLSHANSGVTAGTYKSVTVDAKGHVTGGTNPTTLGGYGITDAKINDKTITLGNNSVTVPTKTSELTNNSNFITNTGSTSGNAGSATKLETARTIEIGTGATGTATSFDGTKNITIPITDVKDAYITWGGKNVAGNITPDDMGCIDEFGHNKLAFLPASCITAEYTTDGGTTWLDYGLTDTQKIAMVTTSGSSVTIGKGTATATAGTLTNDNCNKFKARVKISTRDSNGAGKIYTAGKKWILNMTSNGAGGCKVLVETRTIGNYNNNVDSWSTYGTYEVNGWSGWNSLPVSITFGGGANQTGQIADIRFTLSITSVNTSFACTASFLDFRLIGGTNWAMPSELARAGHLYTMDVNQNATFPKNLTTNGTFTANDFSTKKMIINTTKLPIANGKISSIAANNTYIGSDGIGMSNPGTPNDAGWLRMLGTGENDSVLELAVGDDGSSAAGSASNEEIAVRKYSTSNSISKEIKLFDKDNNSSFPGSITATGGFIGNLTGTASKATGDKNGDDITTTYYKASNPNGYTSNVGTITGITMNGTSKGTSGVVNLGTVATTDTKNTAGSTDSSSKLYLVGATSQAANPQTYSQDTTYVDTDGHLYSNSKQVVNLSDSQALTNKNYSGYTLILSKDDTTEDNHLYTYMDTDGITLNVSNPLYTSGIGSEITMNPEGVVEMWGEDITIDGATGVTINNLVNPTAARMPATKQYVDNLCSFPIYHLNPTPTSSEPFIIENHPKGLYFIKAQSGSSNVYLKVNDDYTGSQGFGASWFIITNNHPTTEGETIGYIEWWSNGYNAKCALTYNTTRTSGIGWSGVNYNTGMATVARTGSYNDLEDKPSVGEIHSGTGDPAADLGNDGDLYIKLG